MDNIWFLFYSYTVLCHHRNRTAFFLTSQNISFQYLSLSYRIHYYRFITSIFYFILQSDYRLNCPNFVKLIRVYLLFQKLTIRWTIRIGTRRVLLVSLGWNSFIFFSVQYTFIILTNCEFLLQQLLP